MRYAGSDSSCCGIYELIDKQQHPGLFSAVLSSKSDAVQTHSNLENERSNVFANPVQVVLKNGWRR